MLTKEYLLGNTETARESYHELSLKLIGQLNQVARKVIDNHILLKFVQGIVYFDLSFEEIFDEIKKDADKRVAYGKNKYLYYPNVEDLNLESLVVSGMMNYAIDSELKIKGRATKTSVYVLQVDLLDINDEIQRNGAKTDE